MNTLSLKLFDRQVQIQCADLKITALVKANYGQMETEASELDLQYRITRGADPSLFYLTREGRPSIVTTNDGELLFHLEKDLTVELQKQRPDLYFLHAAALGFADKAFLLVAPSGSGKSLTTWALLHNSCRYCSDELGPIDLNTFEVQPYPHALCLKSSPPECYPLPTTTLFTPPTIHIPTSTFIDAVCVKPLPLAAVFFLQYHSDIASPQLRLMTKAEAGARLFVNALNPLAHPGEGLDAALAIASHTKCFQLLSADLPATCSVVKAALQQMI